MKLPVPVDPPQHEQAKRYDGRSKKVHGGKKSGSPIFTDKTQGYQGVVPEGFFDQAAQQGIAHNKIPEEETRLIIPAPGQIIMKQ